MKYIQLLILAAILLSCSEDQTESLRTPNDFLLQKEVVHTTGHDVSEKVISIEYTYDDNEVLTSIINNGEKSTVVINQENLGSLENPYLLIDGPSERKQYFCDNTRKVLKEINSDIKHYSYDSENKISRVVVESLSDMPNDTIDYTYDFSPSSTSLVAIVSNVRNIYFKRPETNEWVRSYRVAEFDHYHEGEDVEISPFPFNFGQKVKGILTKTVIRPFITTPSMENRFIYKYDNIGRISEKTIALYRGREVREYTYIPKK